MDFAVSLVLGETWAARGHVCLFFWKRKAFCFFASGAVCQHLLCFIGFALKEATRAVCCKWPLFGKLQGIWAAALTAIENILSKDMSFMLSETPRTVGSKRFRITVDDSLHFPTKGAFANSWQSVTWDVVFLEAVVAIPEHHPLRFIKCKKIRFWWIIWAFWRLGH